MVKIKLNLPIDLTFLSEVIYEGILFSILKSSPNFNFKEIIIEPDFLPKAYGELDEAKIDSIRIVMSGNDSINFKIFEKLNLMGIRSRKTYYDLIKVLKTHSSSLTSKEEIDLGVKTTKRDVLIDIENKKEGLSAPQLFKIDRYTGITSLDTEYTSQQLTFYFSKEVALIALLGVYSSFVTTIKQQKQTYHYFLFFSPDEIVRMLSEGKEGLIEKYFLIKDKAAKELREIIGKSSLSELIITEIGLNVELQNMMVRENLDKMSLILFKIAPEGQTYKIYEQIPITIFRETIFYKISEKHFRDPMKLSERLSEVLSPDGIVLKTLSTLNRQNKAEEADNVLKAIQNLYKFIILGDLQGWFGFLRELWNAHEKRKDSKGRSKYLSLIMNFAYLS